MVKSSAGDEMSRQEVNSYGVVLVERSTLTAQRLQGCVDRNGLSSWVERWGRHAQQNAGAVDGGFF